MFGQSEKEKCREPIIHFAHPDYRMSPPILRQDQVAGEESKGEKVWGRTEPDLG